MAALAVPAAALMLGAAQAGTTVGLNFQDWYYRDGGAGYQTTGMPVTGAAFGVAAANWFKHTPAKLQCMGWSRHGAHFEPMFRSGEHSLLM